jgi:hypothetical protein
MLHDLRQGSTHLSVPLDASTMFGTRALFSEPLLHLMLELGTLDEAAVLRVDVA